MMENCRECNHRISAQAMLCPQCGAPYPARPNWDGWGWEYRSNTEILGLPLIHISFKYRANRTPVVARGIIAIGQFGVGIVNVSQVGIGVFSLSQATIAGYAVAQFGFAYALLAQIGIYIDRGYGQAVWKLSKLLGL